MNAVQRMPTAQFTAGTKYLHSCHTLNECFQLALKVDYIDCYQELRHVLICAGTKYWMNPKSIQTLCLEIETWMKFG